MHNIRNVILWTILVLSVSHLGIAQENATDERPKIGLVLSGGGAKGLAHIGALKVLDEAGIKIDYIGGTSMGAIIGALYASGYSGKELDSIFSATNFTQLIQDYVPRSAKAFYEKEDSERYALTLPFIDFKPAIPTAISKGQNIYNLLVKLLYHVRDTRAFNDLPIPFFCIATDVESGEEILLNRGYLPEAILASGTFPSLFEPSEIEGRILIDGGVVNNYPIAEVKAMGADIIIGVDVQHNLSNRESLMSATEILLQINNYRTVRDMQEKSKQTDLYIRPAIDEFSVIDFGLGPEIVQSGEDAAREKMDAIKALMTDANKTKTKPPMVIQDTLTIDRLILMGNNRYTRGYIKGKLRFTIGETITFKKLHQGINNLAATENFKTIRHELMSTSEGVSLVLKLSENPVKNFIRLGAHYDDLYKSGALINLTRKNVLQNDDVASFDFILGDNIRYNFQYYVDKGTYWSYGVNSSFTDFEMEVATDVLASNFDFENAVNIGQLNLDVTDFTNQIYIQTVIQEEFAFSLGLEHKFLQYSTRTLNSVVDDANLIPNNARNERTSFERSNFYSAYGTLTLDTYDDRYFPSKGLFFDGDFHLYLFSSDFNNNFKEFSIAKAKIGAAFPILDKLSLNIQTEGGFKLGTSGVTSFDFILGGFGNDFVNNFQSFLGYDFLSLPGNSFVKAYASFDFEFAQKNHALFEANFANVEDDIFRTGEWFSEPDFSGFAIGYGLESFVGPVQVKYSWSPDTGDGFFFFSVGYWF